MWKKDEVNPPIPAMPDFEEKPQNPAPPSPAPIQTERATIGRSISVLGEVRGNEDLLIQGQIDGTVDLREHSVTVGPEGRVKANITGRVVAVKGEVEGNLHAEEQVILRSSAEVQGDITAPRVVLEDGASFRGLVDMGDPAHSEKSATGGSSLQTKKASDPTKNKPSDSDGAAWDSGKMPTGTRAADPETGKVAVS
jgi:cytoskeletal protein CcmA (bactofilin family)